MPTTPPTITSAPPVPQRGIKATFGPLVDAFNTWKANSVAQVAALATNVYNNAVEAFNSATTASTAAGTATSAAAAAATTANVTLWVSGQSVAQYASKISPLDGLTYRRITATGVSNTDPKIDTANYIPLLSALTRTFTSADQTWTSGGNLTIGHGLGAMPKLVLIFGRDTVTGRIYPLPSAVYRDASNALTGAHVSYDAANIYLAFSVNPPPVPNSVFFVRAFV